MPRAACHVIYHRGCEESRVCIGAAPSKDAHAPVGSTPLVAPRGQRAAPLSKTPSPQTERQLLSLCIAGCWLARQLLVFALLVVTEGFWGRLLPGKLFFFPGGRSGEQAGRGRKRERVGAAARDARVLWKGSGLVMAGCRALRPGAPGSGAAAAAAPIPTPGTCCTAATAPGDISQ